MRLKEGVGECNCVKFRMLVTIQGGTQTNDLAIWPAMLMAKFEL